MMRGCRCHKQGVSRREFLRATGGAALGILAAACGSREPASVPDVPAADTVSVARPATVSIASAANYEREAVYQRVRDLLDGIGGLRDVVRGGDRVAVKVNLTGGTGVRPLRGVSATESYVTHPEVVRALGELLRDAGAREILIVEAVYEWESFKLWGYEEIAEAIDATLIDLNAPEPYTDFAATPVGADPFVYREFTFNHVLEDVDVFVSVSKMKNHWWAGVTHTMKNLFGLVPARFYRLQEEHNWRSAFHGEGETPTSRIPRVILDLNRARPVHLGLIDGIKTAQSGEGPWIEGMSPIAPGLLIAGKDPVATDAVATAIMGYEPTAERPDPPFIRGDNHLNLAYALGLGTNRLQDITVVGPAIDDVRTEFQPCWG